MHSMHYKMHYKIPIQTGIFLYDDRTSVKPWNIFHVAAKVLQTSGCKISD